MNVPVWCHLASLAGFFVPFGNIGGPLVLWLDKRKQDAAVDEHGKEAVNFQIAVTIYTLAFVVAAFAMVIAFSVSGMMLVVLGMIGLQLFALVCVIRAALAASRGESYRYPLSLRFIR